MKTLIIYASQHGCAQKCAEQIQKEIDGSFEVVNFKKSDRMNLAEFDTVIIGGSIHAGKIQKKVRKFCQTNLAKLKKKNLGLFICCMEEGEKAEQQFRDAFPEELIHSAKATGIFGGEFNFEKMNFFEKTIVKKVAGVEESVSKISEERVDQFIRQMNA